MAGDLHSVQVKRAFVRSDFNLNFKLKPSTDRSLQRTESDRKVYYTVYGTTVDTTSSTTSKLVVPQTTSSTSSDY